MQNILTEKLISLDGLNEDGSRVRTRETLPGVMAALMKNRVESFPAARVHHGHALHTFMVQLGAMALDEAGLDEPPASEQEWLGLIRGTTPDYPEDDPWQLVMTDITRPAFMQPPARGQTGADDFARKERDSKKWIHTPDQLDMLAASKNHEVKRMAGIDSEPEDWIMALISLQTMSGACGQGNYCISRMNAGCSSRAGYSLAPSDGLGSHVRSDILNILLEGSEDRRDGVKLVWTEPWDGEKDEQLRLEQLAPLYIEVCRRVRLYPPRNGGKLWAIASNSKNNRIEKLNGLTGDPWMPVNPGEEKSLTINPNSMRFNQLGPHLVSDEWVKPLLMRREPIGMGPDAQTRLFTRGIAGGQCKTEGYLERDIVLRPRMLRILTGQEENAFLKGLVQSRLERVRKMKGILANAIQACAGGGLIKQAEDSPEDRKKGRGQKKGGDQNGGDQNGGDQNGGEKKKRYEQVVAEEWIERFDQLVDPDFFERLQDMLETADEDDAYQLDLEWKRDLLDWARTILEMAIESTAGAGMFRYRARAVAGRIFEGRIRVDGGLPELFEKNGEDGETEGGDNGMNQPQVDTIQDEAGGTGGGEEAQVEYAPAAWAHTDAPIAVKIARTMAKDVFPAKDMNLLAGMDPDSPRVAPLYRLMTENYLYERGDDRKWALIIRGIAMMTPSQRSGNGFHSAHNGYMPVGRALYHGNNPQRETPFYDENQMAALLTSTGRSFQDRVLHMLTAVIQTDQRFNWREMASFILNDGYDRKRAEQSRRRIAEEYYRAQRLRRRSEAK